MPIVGLPESNPSEPAKALVFEDPRSQALFEQIRRVAGSEAPVLLVGEPGTGRERIARHLHDTSLRRSGPFLAIDCKAFSAQALEAELFGQAKDPSAGPARAGILENARGGSVFIEGLSALGESTQVKLLRAFREQQVRRLGARRYRRIDARVVVASEPLLERAVVAKAFRADLWHLLSVHRIEVPALRERPRDILPLARHFLQVYQQKIGVGSRVLDAETEATLESYDFPGNIRELETVMHRAILRSRGRFITKVDLSIGKPSTPETNSADPLSELGHVLQRLFDLSPPHLHELIDETVLKNAYRYSGYNQLKTARILGMSRNVVRTRLVQYGEVPGLVRSAARPSASPAKPRTAPRARPTVRIGYQRVWLLSWLRVHGILESAYAKVGYGVEWCHYPSGSPLIDAFRDGELSLGVVGEAPAILAQATSVPVVCIATDAPAPGSVALLVHADSSIQSVSELRGKRVAVAPSSTSHSFLIRAIEEASVDYADLGVKLLFPNAARVAFQHREVDAWAIGDPVLAEAQQSFSTRILRDGHGLITRTPYYLANKKFSESRPDLVEIFQEELKNARTWVREHIEEAAESLAPSLGIEPEALALCLRRSLGEALDPKEFIASQQRVADALFAMKFIPRAVCIAQTAKWAPIAQHG